MTCALITGATGFLGRATAEAAREAGWTMHATIRSGSPPPGASAVPIADAYDVEAAMRAVRPDVVLHLAAPPADADAQTIVEAAVGLPAAIAAGAETCATPPVVVETASWWEWDQDGAHAPLNAYAAGKAAGRGMLAQAHRRGALRLVSLIIHDLYGPDDPRPKLLPALLAAARRGDAIALTEGRQVLDWLHVEDAAAAVLAAARAAPGPDAPPALFSAAAERFDLRTIADLINAVGGRLAPQWGARPQPAHARRRPTDVAPPPPAWAPQRRLAGFIGASLAATDVTA